jgi:hypothetical protein
MIGQSLLMNCRYSIGNYLGQHITNIYTCSGSLLRTGDKVNIEEVTGGHMAGKTNNDVDALYYGNQMDLTFIPQNSTSFFPNLKVFVVNRCGLKVVNGADLKQFGPGLNFMSLNFNLIEQVSHDLFEFLPNLIFLDMDANGIRHIGHDAFDAIPKLSTLLFNNLCIVVTIGNNATAVANKKFEMSLKCPPTIQMLEDQLFSRQKFETSIDSQVSERTNPLVLKVYQLEKQNEESEQKITMLEESIAKHEQKIARLEAKIDQLLNFK